MYLSNLKVALDNKVDINVVSESSVLLSFNVSNSSSSLKEKSEYLLEIFRLLMTEKPQYLIDCILSYDTLLLEYDCINVDHYYVISKLQNLRKTLKQQNNANAKSTNNEKVATIHTVDVCYEYASVNYPNDIEIVCEHLNVSGSQIINLHANRKYMVFAIGFMPNFAYAGELPKGLHMPRLAKPRLKVPAGAVAIADNQTAIYPNKSPGGWHILGYAPQFFSSETQPEFNMGDKIIFKPIGKQVFLNQTGIGS